MKDKRSVWWWTAVAVALVVFLWFVPQLQGRYFSPDVNPRDLPALINEYRRTWAQIIAGFALVLGLYFTWRRVEISQRTLEVSQDQQVTERFTRAIDQLGAADENGKRLEIRLGGIYALERIARDSPERDYGTVMEVLAAYVRENAPRHRGIPSFNGSPAVSVDPSEFFESTMSNKPPIPKKTPADIQAILDVLVRRGHGRDPRGNTERLNLRTVDLRKIDLAQKDLRNITFDSTDFEQAVLYKANLEGVHLEEADFRNANLREANLEGAYLAGANFAGAALARASLEGAYLQGAHFKGADVEKTSLEGAFLEEATGLTSQQLLQASGDDHTALPAGLESPSSWTSQSTGNTA